MKFIILFHLILAGAWAWAHGEDKAGPHGGFIQMPGAFHTEVVPEGDTKLRIYLLDLNWKNPMTKNSKLAAGIRPAQQLIPLKCEPRRDYFFCLLPSTVNLRSGKLEIQAERDGQKGNLAVYELPLKLPISKPEHEGHH